MFFIAGTGNQSKKLGKINAQHCPSCQSFQGMELIKTYGYVHLFFVPAVKFDVKYLLVCPQCGKVYQLQKEDGRALEKGRLPALAAERLAPAPGYQVQDTRFCPRCGSEVSPADQYCRHCGQPL